MSIGPKFTSGQNYFYLNSSACQICTVQEEKDLGVTFDDNLYFKTRLNQIVLKYSIVKTLISKNQVLHML